MPTSRGFYIPHPSQHFTTNQFCTLAAAGSTTATSIAAVSTTDTSFAAGALQLQELHTIHNHTQTQHIIMHIVNEVMSGEFQRDSFLFLFSLLVAQGKHTQVYSKCETQRTG